MKDRVIHENISRIYDVVTDPNSFSSMMTDLSESISALGMHVYSFDEIQTELVNVLPSRYMQPAMEVYLTEYANKERPRWEAIQNNTETLQFIDINEFFRNYDLNTDAPLGECPVNDWLIKDFNIHHRYTSTLNREDSHIDSFMIHNDKPLLTGALQVAEVYMHHLSKVTSIYRPFRILQTRFNAVLEVLDKFHLGVFILSNKREVVLSNLTAKRMIERGVGLSMNFQKVLSLTDTKGNLLFKKAVQESTGVMRDGQTSQEIYAARDPAKAFFPPIMLDVSPIQSGDLALGYHNGGVIVVVTDPMHIPPIDPSATANIYNFTPSERAVCKLMLEGLSTEEIAESRTTQQNTVQIQIKSILSKTSTRNRTELLLKIVKMQLPIDRVDG